MKNIKYCNKEKYDYFELEKHFIESKTKCNNKRLPRKLKKNINKFIVMYHLYSDKKDLDTTMWYLRWFINPDYNRFIIKKTCENKNSGKWKN